MTSTPVSTAPSTHAQSSDPRSNVFVTGGARGIGRAICLEFGRARCRVGVHCRARIDEARRTVAEVTQLGGEGTTYQADIRRADEVEKMMRNFVERWGQMDVLICSAGYAVSQLLLRLDSAAWRDTIDINLTGTFLCMRTAADHMLTRGGGAIIVVSSYAAVQGQPGQAAYAASKAGLLALVKTAAREWGTRNVTVNAVFPGWHRTDLTRDASVMEGEFEDHALRRSPDLDDVARTVYHLAHLRDVSGQVWNLDSRIL